MAKCEITDETSEPAVGICLVLISCLCYSFGNCLQRYSLLRKPNELVFGCLNRNYGWMLGACIYFSANGIFSIALSFAPITLLAAVFSLTIVTNSACSVYFLGDRIPRVAYFGYFLVLLGAIVFAVAFRAEVCHFDGGELVEVMLSLSAFLFWMMALSIIGAGASFAYYFEKKYPLINDTAEEIDNEFKGTPGVELDGNDKNARQDSNVAGAAIGDENNDNKITTENEIPSNVNLRARIIYPATLGMIETVGFLLLKAVNSLLTSNALDDDEDSNDTVADKDFPNDIGLWITLVVLGFCMFIGIIKFLRLVYARFEITGAFPVEFGFLTLTSLFGGFAVFQDYNYVEDSITWLYISLASLSILGGISIVAYGSRDRKSVV